MPVNGDGPRLPALIPGLLATSSNVATTTGTQAVELTQIRRYEAGTSAPTLDVLRNIAIALNVTADSLIFGDDERGPTDDLALVFEAASQLDDEGKNMIRALVEGAVLRHQARRFHTAS